MFFKKRSQIKDNTTQTDDGSSKSSAGNNKEAFKAGSSIAKLITSYWNSQENQGKSTFLTDEFIMVELDLC